MGQAFSKMQIGFLSLLTLVLCFMAGCKSTINEKDSFESVTPARENRIETAKLVSRNLVRQLRISGELAAYRDVALFPKVQGFIKSVFVDRGSVVKPGQILIEIVAPEINAQYGEAEGKLQSARSALLESKSKIQSCLALEKEAESKLAADDAVYKRIQHAANTPGAIAPSDLEEANQKACGDRAHVQSMLQIVEAAKSQYKSEEGKVKAAEQALSSIREMKAYLTIRAPFEGVITERNVHEGSLVHSSNMNKPMLRIQQTSMLRLLVPVPESAISGVKIGETMRFTVPAYTGKTFSGTIKRIGHALDIKTRTMPVELDVPNLKGDLQPGMYPDVIWTMERPYPTIFAPSSAVTTIDEKAVVFCVENGIIKTVEVSSGQPMDNLVEIVGNLKAGDEVILKATDEFKSGMRIKTKLVSPEKMEKQASLESD